ncbi:site-2 protease family protein [Oscillatoria sp. FACHB-1406]|uniref:site-2 protease family protein n=1 Tax=Oscillatoria sp. FACHB-1406 TaxID=2692846 RepID=UPI0016854D90|nr:site-2 protease family protein [Oscillatoria sp. FACHB-1406]MBD2579093.1 site-2 protease family protein [Oscillatoria sp. FACHB-1406]
MFNRSESFAVISILLLAAGILIWGYNRAKPYGKAGLLAWLQSVVLMVPWLVFFGLFSTGIALNAIALVGLLVVSAGIYIYLGNRLRAAGQDSILRDRNPSPPPTELTATPPSTPEAAPSIAPEVLPIPEADLQEIQKIFGIDTFFATETISYQEGAIFKGNLRGEAAEVRDRLADKLAQRFDEKYRLFLVESPDGKPTIVILPSSRDPEPLSLAQKNLAIVLLVCTIATSIEAAALLRGFDWFSELGRYREALPIAAGLWTILIAHELGHGFFARKHNVRLSWPFFLPSWQIGSFGALTRFQSLLPNRSVLFDIALAGPVAGGLVSLVMLVVGLILSHPGSLFQLPAQFFQGSIVVGMLAKVFLGDALKATTVDVHPLAVLGWLGLVITALNLMPAGQLDGGRIVQAIYGRRMARRATIATLVVLGIIAVAVPGNPIPLYWGFLILFLQRDLERPSLNELTEPDDLRASLGLLALFLMLLVLIPLTPALALRLGIGA